MESWNSLNFYVYARHLVHYLLDYFIYVVVEIHRLDQQKIKGWKGVLT